MEKIYELDDCIYRITDGNYVKVFDAFDLPVFEGAASDEEIEIWTKNATLLGEKE